MPPYFTTTVLPCKALTAPAVVRAEEANESDESSDDSAKRAERCFGWNDDEDDDVETEKAEMTSEDDNQTETQRQAVNREEAVVKQDIIVNEKRVWFGLLLFVCLICYEVKQ